MVAAKCTECGASLEVTSEIGSTVTCESCGIKQRVIEINQEAGKAYLEVVEDEEEGFEEEDR
jgi:hypothetical protein